MDTTYLQEALAKGPLKIARVIDQGDTADVFIGVIKMTVLKQDTPGQVDQKLEAFKKTIRFLNEAMLGPQVKDG